MGQNQSNAKLYSLRDVVMRYKRLHDKELDFYTMLELSESVIKKAGSIAPRYYVLKTKIKDYEANLPCNVHSIEWVSDAQSYSWLGVNGYPVVNNLLFNYRVDQSGNYGIYNPDATQFDVINAETPKVYEVNKNVFERQGPMLNYQNDDNCCLSFNIKERDIVVLYRGSVVDEEGYLRVPDKTIEAITYWCILHDIKKRFYANQATGEHLAVATQDWKTAISQARTPESLGENESNELMDALTTHNRKLYGRQFKA